MNTPAVPTVALADRPIFVLGERAPAMQLVQALGETPTLCAIPANRLLPDLVSAVDRCAQLFDRAAGPSLDGLRPASWYRELQATQARATGKPRTVEFSGVSVLRLCALFPGAQFVVVRQLKRAMPRSRQLPTMAEGHILEVDSAMSATPDTLEGVLAFLGEPAEPIVLDLSDDRVNASRQPGNRVGG